MTRAGWRIVNKRAFFITGTDTGVGKTLVAAGLLLAAGERGYRTAGIKPVAAGADVRDEQLVNDDAVTLQSVSTLHLDYALVNPYLFEPPIAPHVAAARAGVKLSVVDFVRHFEKLAELDADLVVVEGAGGWLVPINDTETLADVCVALQMPAILVVGLRLGCLNHALLTAAAMDHAGVEFAGWVGNCIVDDMAARDENLQCLRERLPAPCLGVVPFLGSGLIEEDIEVFLDIDSLLG